MLCASGLLKRNRFHAESRRSFIVIDVQYVVFAVMSERFERKLFKESVVVICAAVIMPRTIHFYVILCAQRNQFRPLSRI